MGQKEWVERPYDPDIYEQLKKELSPLLSLMLAKRKVRFELAEEFLEPGLKNLKEPYLFADMEKATHRIAESVLSGQAIGIFGDYDVDGVCSTALLHQFLSWLGAKVFTTLPNRMIEGYGLSRPGIDRLHEKGVKLLITVDCGITALEQVDYANSLGLEVIIVDHHTVGDVLPKAVAVINPKRADCSSKASFLCAAGVAFFLCMALRRHLRQRSFFLREKEPDLKELLDLVALATVCDVVPLIEDNRALVKAGLKMLKVASRTGLSALIDVSGIDRQKISSTNLGFHLGPRINAAGRLEDATLALDLMNSKDQDEAQRIASELNLCNLERQAILEETVLEACAVIDGLGAGENYSAWVIHNEAWHPGVVGIVASRIAERYHRPAIIIGEKGKGSGRSIKGIDLHAMVQKASQSLSGFGGHAHAIGLTLGPKGVETFRQDLLSAMGEISSEVFAEKIYYDALVNFSDLTMSFCEDLARLEPFGAANPYPVLRVNGAHMRNIRRLNGGHLKGELENQDGFISFISFRMDIDDNAANQAMDYLGILEKNEWQGRVSLQLRLLDFKATQS